MTGHNSRRSCLVLTQNRRVCRRQEELGLRHRATSSTTRSTSWIRHSTKPSELRCLERRSGVSSVPVEHCNGGARPADRVSPGDAVIPPARGVDLFWLPLGAGGHSVRLNGLVFEAIAARLQHRGRADLYHSALEVHLPGGRFVIEQAPAWRQGGERGVVAEGPVGTRAAGRLRLFRYEVRRWRDGVIPDVAEAVESPRRLSDDPRHARRLLELVPNVPTLAWGRDELGTGEMWN